MRKLYSYRNRLSTRGTTTITDENGSNVYLINGRWGCTPASCRSTLHLICLKPKSSNAHLECCQSLIYTKTQVCRLDSPILRCQSRNAVREKLNWLIMGNLSTYNYRVFHGRECIMTINEVQLASGDYLEFTISHEEDEALLLCIASILDYWAKTGTKARNRRFGCGRNLAFD